MKLNSVITCPECGHKKEKEGDLFQILTSSSWEQIDGFYNGEYYFQRTLLNLPSRAHTISKPH